MKVMNETKKVLCISYGTVRDVLKLMLHICFPALLEKHLFEQNHPEAFSETVKRIGFVFNSDKAEYMYSKQNSAIFTLNGKLL